MPRDGKEQGVLRPQYEIENPISSGTLPRLVAEDYRRRGAGAPEMVWPPNRELSKYPGSVLLPSPTVYGILDCHFHILPTS